MLETLQRLPEDPLLGVMAAYRRDTDPLKVDLGVGVYKTEDGETPILRSIRQAALALANEQTSKVYVGQAGNARFNQSILQITLGADHPAVTPGRAVALQAPGGCGALRLGAELLKKLSATTIHVSDPTWANHVPLLGNAGLSVQSYPYFDRATGDVRVAAMLDKLQSLPSGSIVLLHGCCHNPSGADLPQDAWLSIAQVMEQRGLVPFIDVAYQGLGVGLNDDAFGARLLAERLPETLIAVSCSKNFGLYRERTGAIIATGRTAEHAQNAILQIQQIARGIYSMPPDYGAELVARVWENPALREDWIREVEEMRQRMASLRQSLLTKLRALRPEVDYSFLTRQRGMFSLLPLSPAQIATLRDQRHVYMPSDGRINVAGISNRNVEYLAQSLAGVIE